MEPCHCLTMLDRSVCSTPLVVPKLDRLGRSVPDARAIGDELAAQGVSLSLVGRSTTPPIRWASCSSISLPRSLSSKLTCSGCAPAKAWRLPGAKGKLKGRQPKLSTKQQTELVRMHKVGGHSITDLAEVFSVSRPTVYRIMNRATAHNA